MPLIRSVPDSGRIRRHRSTDSDGLARMKGHASYPSTPGQAQRGAREPDRQSWLCPSAPREQRSGQADASRPRRRRLSALRRPVCGPWVSGLLLPGRTGGALCEAPSCGDALQRLPAAAYGGGAARLCRRERADRRLDLRFRRAGRGRNHRTAPHGGGPLLEGPGAPTARAIRARPPPYPKGQTPRPGNGRPEAGRGPQHP